MLIHVYRLVDPDSPHAPEMLWEWERRPIDHLLQNARIFGREVVQRSFADWRAFAAENLRIWQLLICHDQPISLGIRGRRG